MVGLSEAIGVISKDCTPQGVRRNDPEILRDEIAYASLDLLLVYFILAT
jgi:hypothetical protein